MANSADRVKEHARVRLMDYWILHDEEKVQLPLQQDGFCGHFGEVLNYALKRALRELNFPWEYDIETDRISLKHFDDIKLSVQNTFKLISNTQNICLDELVSIAVYYNEKSKKYYGVCIHDNEDVQLVLDGMNLVVYLAFKLV